MIYRILTDSVVWTPPYVPSGSTLRGAHTAGVSGGWADLAPTGVQTPAARHYFTELGWKRYGRVVAAEARRQGHVVRIIRRKNPARSQVVYQDAFQVAILPARRRDHNGRANQE